VAGNHRRCRTLPGRRQVEPGAEAAETRAAQLDRTAIELGDIPNDIEAQAVARNRLVEASPPLQDLRLLFLGDSGAIVLDRGDGELLRYPIKRRMETGPKAEFVRRGLVVGSSPVEATVAAIPAVLSALGIEGIDPRDVKIRKPPRLRFEMEADGGRWLVSYDQVRRTVAAKPIDRTPNISARNYLLGLHKANGYPMQPGARSIWAVLVDVTVIVMMVWVLSGLFMWLQMRNMRAVGAVSLCTGLASAGVVGYVMYLSFLS
jgi:hypothetical protein